jgi:alpha-mannosidase
MNTDRIVVLEQFAHLDWDWNNTFLGYFNGNVLAIYRGVNAAPKPFPYSVCEMGFLRYFAENYEDEFQAFAANDDLTVVGGAITSPDNLLTSGEAFFRAFLTGLHWLPAPLQWSTMVWLPDDFGHDSQLPVTLVAMGAGAVAFARVPGDSTSEQSSPQRPLPAPGSLLNQDAAGVGGLDFWWRAADGSTIFAHWMPNDYWLGGGISGEDAIQNYLDQNKPGSPSRYVHVPVGADFLQPNPHVPNYVSAYNSGSGGDQAVVDSFAWYVARVKEEVSAGRARLKTRTFHGDPADLETTSFLANPYFMGFYASRMELKNLHYETARLLVQAEVLDAACAAGGIRDAGIASRLLAAWNDLAPSTHHDYVTGTADDAVYQNEQLPLSKQVHADALQLRADLTATVAKSLGTEGGAFLSFNTLGFARSGVVRFDDGFSIWADVPAMGWRVTRDGRPPREVAFLRDTDDEVQLDNGVVSFTVTRSANWGISSFSRSGSTVSVLSGTGNALQFWQDPGNIYTFGYECRRGGDGFTPAPISVRPVGGRRIAIDALRVRASVTVDLEVVVREGRSYPYTLTYTLCAGDPFVAISITGAAPPQTSVFVDFPFDGGPIDRMEHGTPNHWDHKKPGTFGTSSYRAIFEPTHDFVSVWNGEKPLGAMYHGGVPAWAVDGSTLTGCILRNTGNPDSCSSYGAIGSDPDRHTITFALRIGDGLQHAETGAPLREARAFSNPLFGVFANDGSEVLPTTYSLASSSENALLTVAKRGTADPDDLYLRVYTPGNREERVELTVAAPFSQTAGATALERPLPAEAEAALNIDSASGRIRFTATNAVNTLQLK